MSGELWNAMRSHLRTRRVTTLAVIATIGIVLGGVTMIFGLVNAVLLRPLPYPDADRLVTVRLNERARGLSLFMPFPLFEQLSSRVRSVAQMAAQARGGRITGGLRWVGERNAPYQTSRAAFGRVACLLLPGQL